MTLNDLEPSKDIFCNFRLQCTFQQWIATRWRLMHFKLIRVRNKCSFCWCIDLQTFLSAARRAGSYLVAMMPLLWSQVIRGEPVTRPANQLSAHAKSSSRGNGGGRQPGPGAAPKSPRICPSSPPPHLPTTNVPSPRNRARHSLNVRIIIIIIILFGRKQKTRNSSCNRHTGNTRLGS